MVGTSTAWEFSLVRELTNEPMDLRAPTKFQPGTMRNESPFGLARATSAASPCAEALAVRTMIRIGPSRANVSNPTQQVQMWKQRCIKEEGGKHDESMPYVLLSNKRQLKSKALNPITLSVNASSSRRQRNRMETPEQDDKSGQLSARSNSSSCSDATNVSLVSGRSSASTYSATSNKSKWSLRTFCTEDSGFTYYANKRFDMFEKALAEEREKRQAAEAKLDRLLALLEKKQIEETKACK
jgi:hypothetical protein